jgi:hypothetical protein
MNKINNYNRVRRLKYSNLKSKKLKPKSNAITPKIFVVTSPKKSSDNTLAPIIKP